MEAPPPSPSEPFPRNSNPSPSSPSPSPYPPPSRLWRPAAQRNVRNRWSALRSGIDHWTAAASEGRAHATALVNAHLSQRYLPDMELGALKDMPGIREKSVEKLARKQDIYCKKLLSSYKDMVIVVSHLVKAAISLRCFVKGSVSSPLIQFCDFPEDENDKGDGGGVPVFSYFPISYFENLAQELAEMFVLELSLKRLLVAELLSTSCKEALREQTDLLSWSHELYPGEYDDMKMCCLPSAECCQPFPPRIKDWQSSNPLTRQPDIPPNHEVLQVYLTAWLADVNIDMNRVEEIFAMIEEEMQIKIS